MIARLAAAALLLAATPASAQDWEFLGASEDLAGAFAIDAQTIKSPTPSTREVKVLMVLSEPYEDVVAIASDFTVDCPSRQKRANSVTGYDSGGNVVGEEGLEADWYPMDAGTPYGSIHARVCESKTDASAPHYRTPLPIAEMLAQLEKLAAGN